MIWIHLEKTSLLSALASKLPLCLLASMLPLCLLDFRVPVFLAESFYAGLINPSQTSLKTCRSSGDPFRYFRQLPFLVLILYYLFHISFPVRIFFLSLGLSLYFYLFYSIYCNIISKVFVSLFTKL